MSAPFIPWIGGKRRLAERLIRLFPPHDCYVEVFCGAAAVFFMRPQPADVEVINDINGELVNLYRVVKHHLEEFVRQFKWALSSREIYRWQQITPGETLTDIQRAARFYYLQQLAFGGKVQGQTFGTATTTPPGLNLLRLEEALSAAHLRLSNTYSRTCPGPTASPATTVRTPSSTWTRPTGRPKATACRSPSRNTSASPASCDR